MSDHQRVSESSSVVEQTEASEVEETTPSEVEQTESSEESDFPPVSQLLDDKIPSEEGNEKEKKHAITQKGNVKNQALAPTARPLAVKAEVASSPPSTSSWRSEPILSNIKQRPASASQVITASQKKPKVGNTATPVDRVGEAVRSRSESVSNKRKRADDEDLVADSKQAKTKHVTGDKVTKIQKKNTSVDVASSDVQEIPPCIPQPKTKVKKPSSVAPAISASQPERLPSAASTMMAPPSPPYSTQPPSRQRTRKASLGEPLPSLPVRRNRALSKAVRSTDYWYLDGSVVIWVQKTLYKLHRSSLAKRSKYFRRMFGDSLPAQSRRGVCDEEMGSDGEEPEVVEIAGKHNDGLVEGELMDSCSVYRVTVVSTEDFEALLDAWEDGFSFAHTPPPFLTLACLLRASYALDCERVWEYASRVFSDMWPSDLASLAQPTPEQQAYAKEALQLARACGLPGVRKRAYYELVCTPGFGQVATDDIADSVDDEVLESGKAALSYADVLRLVKTRAHLEDAWLALARAPPTPSVVPCPLDKVPQQNLDPSQKTALEKCLAARNNSQMWWMEQVVQAPLFKSGLLDPLCGLQELVNIDWKDQGFCIECEGARRDLWQAEMKKIWGKLDVWLGLAVSTEDKVEKKAK